MSLSYILHRLRHRCRILGLVTMAAFAVVNPALAENAKGLEKQASGVSVRFPKGSIQSAEIADRALAAVAAERTAIDARFTEQQQACFPKFFANVCVDEAKEERRVALSRLHPIEVEAKAFKRRERALERDKALEKNRVGDAQKPAIRGAGQPQDRQLADAPLAPAAVAEASPRGEGPRSGGPVTDRAARHEARLKRMEAEEQANAQKRAENVEAYNRKVEKAEARQREVAARKKEREEERARKKATSSGS